jgi:hypothetical protein
MEPWFGPDGSPHTVSQASLMEPPTLSVTVRIRCIDAWEECWAKQQWRCRDLDVNDLYPRCLGRRPGDETLDACSTW